MSTSPHTARPEPETPRGDNPRPPASHQHKTLDKLLDSVLGKEDATAWRNAHANSHVNETLTQSEQARVADPKYIKDAGDATTAAQSLQQGVKDGKKLYDDKGQPLPWAKPFLDSIAKLKTDMKDWAGGDNDAIKDDKSDLALRGKVIGQDQKLLATKGLDPKLKTFLLDDQAAQKQLLQDDIKDGGTGAATPAETTTGNEQRYLQTMGQLLDAVKAIVNPNTPVGDIVNKLSDFIGAASTFQSQAREDAPMEQGYKQHLWNARHVNNELNGALNQPIYATSIKPHHKEH